MGCDSHGVIEVDIHDGEHAEDYEIFLFLEKEAEKARKKAQQNRDAKEDSKESGKAASVGLSRVVRFPKEQRVLSSMSGATA